jgi:exopolysaccharide biosynthesis protein
MLDKASFTDYTGKNPDALKNGYDKLLINEAGLNKKGTTIRTQQGEQVLVLDAENGILIVKVTGSEFQGKLAIIRNAAQVRLGVSKSIGSYGQPVGEIAKAYNAVLAINASGFVDPGGNGSGGSVVGLCISGGKQYNKSLGQGYLPIGFGLDNLLYIGVSASKMVYRDAVEFMPALIVNGKDVSAAAENFSGIQPRSVIGQAKDGTVFLLTIDGRQPGWSLGAPVVSCTKLLLKYGAYQAANLDGGSSTIMVYRDEIITKTSGAQGYGRYCPNAFIVDYAKNVKDNSVG